MTKRTKGAAKPSCELVALGSMVPDPTITDLGGIDSSIVTRYALAYKAGDQFPAITVSPDHRVILGLHRYYAMLKAYGAKHKVWVDIRDFGDTRNEVMASYASNARNPRQLNGFIRHRFVHALIHVYHFTVPDVCRASGLPANLTEKQRDIAFYGNQVNVVRGKPSKFSKDVKMPCKGGMAPDMVTAKQYAVHVKHDVGTGADLLAEQLLNKINNGWYVPSVRFEKAMCALGELCLEHGWLPSND